MADPEFTKNVQLLLNAAPPPVRNFLLQKLDGVARELIAKYGLHVDQGAGLHRDLILVLLGADTPEELINNLKTEGGLDDQMIVAIVNDINQQVFVPIQNEMRSAPAQSTPPQVSVPRYQPQMPPQMPSLQPRPVQPQPVMPPPRPMSTPIPPPVFRPQQPAPPRPTQPPVFNQPTPSRPAQLPSFSQPMARPTPPPMPRPMQSAPPANLPGQLANGHLLSDHEVDHINVREEGGAGARGGPITGSMPQMPRPQAAPQAPMPSQVQPPPKREPPPPIPLQKYGADPYREPMDGQ